VSEFSRFETLLHNLRIDQDLGFGTLTATASYHEKTAELVDDLTADLAPLIGAVFGFDASQVISPAPGSSRGKTFEMRLASATGQRFEYLVGAMRDETRMKEYQYVLVPGISPFVDAIFGPGSSELLTPGDSILDSLIPVKGTETAAFGEGTWHFNDQWKTTLGGRAFRTKVDNSSIASGLFVLAQTGEVTNIESGSQKDRGFTPKLSVTWTPSDDLMAYALAARGFRYGGPNIIPSEPGFVVPRTFDSDSLWNYEIGARSNFLERRLQLDGTLFYIDWSDIQLRQQTPSGLNYAVNAGKARSRGVEAAATWLVTPNLKLSANATYLDAELTEDFVSNPGQGIPVTVGAGTPLPGASKWQIADTVSYKWSAGSFEPSFLLAHRYISNATSGVIGQEVAQGDYHLFDARASIQLSRLGITAFVANIGDKRGVATASSGPPLQQFLVRPRTIGITLDYRL
jgi:outer membrane receptor protein involved in Fe transport